MKLLIPGPVTTDPTVRAAAAQDYAPWDNDFRPMNVDVRARVLAIAGAGDDTHATLPLQGCGHFGMEAAFRTFVPRPGKLLIPASGAYADRAIRLAREVGCTVSTIPVPHDAPVDPEALRQALRADPDIRHVALIYSETGSGVIHDVPTLAAVAGAAGCRVIVDAVSAFGALPLVLRDLPMIDAVVFTANKCLEALPGLAFVVARIDRLVECRSRAASWSFDLADIYQHALRVGWGSFRFTPPAQVLAAFRVALDLYDAEGGQPARLARYTANKHALYQGIAALGLAPYLPEAAQGPIVVNVHAPAHPAWDLQAFVDALKRRGYLISNFYNTDAPSFRVGCIGAITPDDMRGAVAAIGAALAELGIQPAQAA